MIAMSDFFHGLNNSQKEAVRAVDGPALVVAGPGTGKTLTICRRIAYLISQGIRPENILAATFTNRAAREMRKRVESLLGRHAEKLFIGTFHLFGLRIIQDSFPDNFVIYNRDEQIELIRRLVKGSGMKAHQIVERISRIKNLMEEADDGIKGIYEDYQSNLKKNSAFDFDDLILKPIELFGNSEILAKYRDTFKYIIVDEYQDINPAQYRLLRLLAGNEGDICAVGDSDQAVYAFRGADITNFLNFEKDFKDAKRITLTVNYRSTGVILNASNSMIKNNQNRIDKEVCTTRLQGNTITLISVPDEKAEGEFIVREIETRIGGTSHYQLLHANGANDFSGESYSFSDFAVLFRTNAQAQAIEEAFATSGIPYQVIGKGASQQSKEIEDTISYMKSIIKPSEDIAASEQASLEEKLLTPADIFDPRADAVALLTMHMAKGLEFKVVFIAGVEEEIIPYTLKKDNVDIEEERRLFYVGMTRAREELFLLYARNRFLYGQRLRQMPSPFLREIPEGLIQERVIPDRMIRQKKDNQIGLF
jgi:DNA helicase-2/ATP-dependent DNA helicase PcrA